MKVTFSCVVEKSLIRRVNGLIFKRLFNLLKVLVENLFSFTEISPFNFTKKNPWNFWLDESNPSFLIHFMTNSFYFEHWFTALDWRFILNKYFPYQKAFFNVWFHHHKFHVMFSKCQKTFFYTNMNIRDQSFPDFFKYTFGHGIFFKR